MFQAVVAKERFAAIRMLWQRIANLRENGDRPALDGQTNFFQRKDSSSGFVRASSIANLSGLRREGNCSYISPQETYFDFFVGKCNKRIALTSSVCAGHFLLDLLG